MLLKGAELKKLRDLMVAAFSPEEIQEFFRLSLDENFYASVASSAAYKHQILTLLTERDRKKKPLLLLLHALAAEIPDEPYIQELILTYQVGFGVYRDDNDRTPLTNTALQAVIADNPNIRLEPFAHWLLNTKKCVCRFEINLGATMAYGTGFLIQPNLLLTNYHVLKKLIKREIDVTKIQCRFDYAYTPDGADISVGNTYTLDPNEPVVACSEYTNFDEAPPASLDDVDWPADKLDYAVAKLQEPVGEMPSGPNGSSVKDTKRGWIKKPSIPSDLTAGTHIFMIQHPMDEPQQLAIGVKKVQGTDRHQRRVRYGITTKYGSSGSAGFDTHFQWSCLHNCGDPARNATYNQGIPSARIVEHLQTQGINL